MPYDDGDPDPLVGDDIADAIALQMNKSLAVVGIEIQTSASGSDDPDLVNAYIEISRGTVVAVRGETALAGNIVVTGDPATADECVVTLCFPLVATPPNGPSGKPIPNWLSVFQFSLSNTYFNATSRSLLE